MNLSLLSLTVHKNLNTNICNRLISSLFLQSLRGQFCDLRACAMWEVINCDVVGDVMLGGNAWGGGNTPWCFSIAQVAKGSLPMGYYLGLGEYWVPYYVLILS